MRSAVLEKLRLVNSTGITLAEYPYEEDFVKSQLAGGIMSAMMKYSKQIHNRDLHSIKMGERSLYFIPVHEFFIILETKLNADEDLIMGAINDLKEKAEMLLSNYTSDNISVAHSQIIISELALIFTRYELIYDMDDMIDEISISDSIVKHFSLSSSDKTRNDLSDIEKDVIEFLNSDTMDLIEQRDYEVFVLYLPKTRAAGIFIATVEDERVDIGATIVKEKEINQLTSLFETYVGQIESMFHMKTYIDKKLLLDSLEKTVSVNRFVIPKEWRSFISLVGLQRLVEKPDQLISAVISGYRVVVFGERILVLIVVATLSVFAQHKPSLIRLWGKSDNLDQFHILGTKSIDEAYMKDKDEFLVCDVNNGRITGEFETTGYLDRVSKLYPTLTDSIEQIKLELEDLWATAVKNTHPSFQVEVAPDLRPLHDVIMKKINPLVNK